jgi:hypothetical protein
VPLVVAAAARNMWRRSLTEKLEQRMLAEAYPDRFQSESSSIPNRAPMQVSDERDTPRIDTRHLPEQGWGKIGVGSNGSARGGLAGRR